MILDHGGRALTLAVAAGVLSACGGSDAGMVNSNICADFGQAAGSATGPPPADAATPVDNCVRRWAYSLAGARDSAEVVATAVVSACGAALGRWNLTATDPAAGDGSSAAPASQSLVTGQPTDAMGEHAAFAQRQALLYVIQARAGHCKAPPASKGEPIGA